MHRNRGEKNKSVQQAKLYLRSVEDTVRTVKGDPEKMLRAVNLLHTNLQFTIETPNTNGNLAFLDLKNIIDNVPFCPIGTAQPSGGTEKDD